MPEAPSSPPTPSSPPADGPATAATAARIAASDGIVVVDKPSGPTSHDVVGRLRRVFGTRRVGHAGTLDPMASGVLVALIGEATKLASFATAHDKTYLARVAFGLSTTTLDAMGERVREEPLPRWLEEALAGPIQGLRDEPRVARAIAAELARAEQIPPAFSAIKLGGKKAYDLARSGAEVELAPREVSLRALTIVGAGVGPEGGYIDAELHTSKGYYVRSFALDLGLSLDVPSHLARLRRLQSGPFTIDAARPLAEPESLRAGLIPLAESARRVLPSVTLTADGLTRARHGKTLTAADFVDAPPSDSPTAWLTLDDRLAAVGQREGEAYRVLRGFTG